MKSRIATFALLLLTVCSPVEPLAISGCSPDSEVCLDCEDGQCRLCDDLVCESVPVSLDGVSERGSICLGHYCAGCMGFEDGSFSCLVSGHGHWCAAGCSQPSNVCSWGCG